MAGCIWLFYAWLGWLCYSKVCYEDLGCFENQPPFHKANFELPQDPAFLQVSFLLYTVNNYDNPQNITSNSTNIEMTEYTGSKRTIFLIHGYRQGPKDSWIIASKDAILEVEDANVVVIDWELGAADLANYYQAAANTRVVGALTAQLMTSLNTSAGARYEDMYMVGYSLGAHIAGYAGERVPNLGRITGLDPAYRAFSEDEPAVRLDVTDAKYVDIIHTDGKQWIWGFGIPDSIGHADFFPNGGLDQPGCEFWSFLMQSTCDHTRSTKYFVESINSTCTFEAVPCKKWKRFKRGKCTCDTETDCGRMGFSEKPETIAGNYYLRTNEQEPFCII